MIIINDRKKKIELKFDEWDDIFYKQSHHCQELIIIL